MKIVCSHWEPFDRERRAEELPCIIYMHGNSSARVEAVPQLPLACVLEFACDSLQGPLTLFRPLLRLSLGATLLAFDFTGSGQSEGQWHENCGEPQS
jgi:hypothetical protein